MRIRVPDKEMIPSDNSNSKKEIESEKVRKNCYERIVVGFYINHFISLK